MKKKHCLVSFHTALTKNSTNFFQTFWKHAEIHSLNKSEQAGTGPSRRHIQGSKIAKTSKSQFTVLENRKSRKNGPSGAPGPASASPWRAKRGTLPKLSTFLSQLKGGPFGEKTDFRKKISVPKKLKGTLWDFPTSILTQNSKKNWRGDPLVSPGMVCYAEKTGETFLVQFARPNGAIWCNNIL